MFTAWMDFAFDAARLGHEMQEVMALRLMKLAFAGPAGHIEVQRMVAEKNVAFAEAAATLATGGSMHTVLRRYRTRVRENKRRLSRR
jgi:hypothetical protein